MKFGIRGHLTDVITCVKFLVDRFRGYGVLSPPKLPFPIDVLRRPYNKNSVALPCDTVITVLHGSATLFLKQEPVFEVMQRSRAVYTICHMLLQTV